MLLPFRTSVHMNLRLSHLTVALMMTVSLLTIGNAIALERKNFSIPANLTTGLKVKVTYNNHEVFFRFEWPSGPNGYFHEYLHFKAGKWVKTSGSGPGSHPLKLYEDRVSFLLDDGSVRYFDSAGGYVTIHERMRFLSNQSSKGEVQKHPYLGVKKKKRMYENTTLRHVQVNSGKIRCPRRN